LRNTGITFYHLSTNTSSVFRNIKLPQRLDLVTTYSIPPVSYEVRRGVDGAVR
jgi:hypothetical protein